MEWLQNFYLGTHSHYQNITPRGASQSVKSEKKKFFLIFLIFFETCTHEHQVSDSAIITYPLILTRI